MISRWIAHLQSRGAVVETNAAGEAVVASFGNPGQELSASRDDSVVAPLSHLGVLAISGEDAGEFLHGQLSSDVKSLAQNGWQYSAYCSAKGRVLANFILWREQTGFRALLSRDLVEAIRKRMSMFVLRSKVRIEDVTSRYAVMGVSGNAVALEPVFGKSPAAAFSVAHGGTGSVLNLGGERFIALVDAQAAESVWPTLTEKLHPVGEAAWRWLDIRAGLPWVSALTQDEFVPQMANLDLIGAVNFQKGCYPGQEIVARTQYLGKLKRRLFRLHADIEPAPTPATSLYRTETGDQACGIVVDAAPAPDGGCDLLAVAQIEAAHESPMHLGSPDGPILSLLGLPYRIPQAA